MNTPKIEGDLRERIIEQPDVILNDHDLMRALVAANERSMGANVVDLRGIAMERLEARLDRLEDTHRSVIAAAYENLAGTQSVHRAVIALIGARGFDDFLAVLADDFRHILALDAVKLCVESGDVIAGQPLGPQGNHKRAILALPRGGAAAYCSDGGGAHARAVLLRPTTRGGSLIYGHRAAESQSEAILRFTIGSGDVPAILVLGASDPKRFHAEQGTDLLTFLGQVVARVTEKWLA